MDERCCALLAVPPTCMRSFRLAVTTTSLAVNPDHLIGSMCVAMCVLGCGVRARRSWPWRSPTIGTVLRPSEVETNMASHRGVCSREPTARTEGELSRAHRLTAVHHYTYISSSYPAYGTNSCPSYLCSSITCAPPLLKPRLDVALRDHAYAAYHTCMQSLTCMHNSECLPATSIRTCIVQSCLAACMHFGTICENPAADTNTSCNKPPQQHAWCRAT